MNKKILLISSVLLTLSIITIIIFNNMDNKENNIISNVEKDTEVINSNMITMMYETEAGTGVYEETKDTTWPESGYIFNENLSGCENGGELEYNSINKTVNLLSNKSDRCYVYFDKYDGVWIDNVSVTNVTGSSVTLDISATSENGNITTYYYALNDSKEYIESTTNSIVINDLNKLTEYKISIYAVDSTNARSNIYEISVSTTDVSVPIINSVDVSNITYNGVTITVNVTSDIGIKRYYYIIENDNKAGTSINNQYVFNDLNDNTNYNLTIFVEDKNGLFSQYYSLNFTTDEAIYFASYIINNVYSEDGVNSLYHFDGNDTSYEINDGSYRFAGSNPNNYVCFGSDADTCPDDNLYRIIGIFDEQVKLIKYESIGKYNWSGSGDNRCYNWSCSTLNTVILNDTFLNDFSDYWINMISLNDWGVGGFNGNLSSTTPPRVYNEEFTSDEIYNAKIGLMYVSEFGFATNPSFWNINMEYFNSNSDLYDNTWFPANSWSISIERMYDYAFVPPYNRYITWQGRFDVNPTFYLSEDVKYIKGIGTERNPYRIGI